MTLEERVERIEQTLDKLFFHKDADVMEQAYDAFKHWQVTKEVRDGAEAGSGGDGTKALSETR